MSARSQPQSGNGSMPMFDRVDDPESSPSTLRELPHSVEAEAGVLGALLLDNSIWPRVHGQLETGDFFRYDHRVIFGTFAAMFAAGEVVEPITVFARLEAEGVADAVGGMPFVHGLMRFEPSPGHVEQYVEIVRQCAARRAAMAEHHRAWEGLADGDALSLRDAAEAAQRASRLVQPDGEYGVVFSHQSPRADSAMPAFVSCHEFIAQYEPAVPVFDALPCTGQRRVVLLTGRTHHGKTSLFALQQVCIAHGLPFAGKPTMHGRVLVFCGENPEDYRLHLVATLLHLGLDPDAHRDIVIVPGRFNIGACAGEAQRRIAALDATGVRAVFVDTSASYFNGDDDKDNMQMYQHASDLRSLTRLPGEPLVMVACHPTKGAERDKLVPRGGGGFLNEVDANTTAWKEAGENSTVELHWCEKLRAPSFDPMTFELHPLRLPARFDGASGQAAFSVAAEYASPLRAQQLEDDRANDLMALLRAFAANPTAGPTELAKVLDWKTGNGAPYKMKASRGLDALADRRLLERKGDALTLTPSGKKAAGRGAI